MIQTWFARAVCREDSESLLQRQLVFTLVFLADISPIASNMSAKKREPVNTQLLHQLERPGLQLLPNVDRASSIYSPPFRSPGLFLLKIPAFGYLRPNIVR